MFTELVAPRVPADKELRLLFAILRKPSFYKQLKKPLNIKFQLIALTHFMA
jgi:hypothetical protein